MQLLLRVCRAGASTARRRFCTGSMLLLVLCYHGCGCTLRKHPLLLESVPAPEGHRPWRCMLLHMLLRMLLHVLLHVLGGSSYRVRAAAIALKTVQQRQHHTSSAAEPCSISLGQPWHLHQDGMIV
jgi:hypothetical protein